MNWKNITRDLLNTGLTQSELAARANCAQSTISELASGKKGKRLDFVIGYKLVELHRELVHDRQINY